MALDYSVIGQRIKQARLAKNLTQEDLAEKIDISVAFLSRVERGNSHINLKRLNQLCGLLDVTEGYLLNGASSNSKEYLDREFADLIKNCSPEKQKLILFHELHDLPSLFTPFIIFFYLFMAILLRLHNSIQRLYAYLYS